MKKYTSEIPIDSVMKKASSLLSKRMHSTAEIRAKLTKKFPENIVDLCINELTRLNFLNDERFAQSYADELQSKGLTPLAICSKMLRRGIPKDLTEKFTPKLSSDEEIRLAEKILKTKLKTLQKIQPIQKQKEKIFRLLKSRGFSNETIFSIFSSLNLNNLEDN